MKYIRKISIAFFALIFLSLSAFAAKDIKFTPIKYVFLFIGDGMSIPQRMMTDEFLRMNGEDGLLINKFPNVAITTTRAANSFITDSAAAGTAIACGEKANNHGIGVDAKGRKLESIATVAKKSGRKVGIVTSVTINHATPAAFYAHNEERGNYYDIALEMLSSNFDFFAGASIARNDDKKAKNYKGDLYALARNDGWKVFEYGTLEQLKSLKKGDEKVMFYASKKGNPDFDDNLGSKGAKESLPYAIDDPNGVRIANLTEKAIELLDNEKGFFLMVEGGKIDWMCHANDAATVIKEMIDFDKAVKVAYEFAQKHPSETLIVVTGDHETGGLGLGFAGTGYKSYINLLDNQKCSRDVLAEKFVELLKKNPKAEFEDFKPLIKKYLGLKFEGKKSDRMVLTKNELDDIEDVFEDALEKLAKKQNTTKELKRVMSKPVNFVTKILDNKAAIGWTSTAHTALPVSTSSYGVQSEKINGAIDNTDIAKMLKQTVK